MSDICVFLQFDQEKLATFVFRGTSSEVIAGGGGDGFDCGGGSLVDAWRGRRGVTLASPTRRGSCSVILKRPDFDETNAKNKMRSEEMEHKAEGCNGRVLWGGGG